MQNKAKEVIDPSCDAAPQHVHSNNSMTGPTGILACSYTLTLPATDTSDHLVTYQSLRAHLHALHGI